MPVVAVLAAAAGWYLAMKTDGGDRSPRAAAPVAGSAPADLLGQHRPDFEHRDAQGTTVSAADFDGRPLLLNFWATWCAPCVEEMPMLSELQDDWSGRGLQVVGIALDDAERARNFADEMGIRYPVLVGETDVVLTGQRYGNRSGLLPFSVLVDRDGTIRWTHLGALDRTDLERELHALQ